MTLCVCKHCWCYVLYCVYLCMYFSFFAQEKNKYINSVVSQLVKFRHVLLCLSVHFCVCVYVCAPFRMRC